MNRICNLENCTGCEACASICPKNCISMISDREGFLRPDIDESKCINCGVCVNTCPANRPVSDNGIVPLTFAARIRDKEILACSSSGGVFSALALRVLGKKGIVIGAGFDENQQVIHKLCMETAGLDELRRSKYVQSRIGTVYQDAKKILENGTELLFCGTPCQVAGLKSFLGREYSNLYTVDFICHGVPSPFVFNQYIEYLKSEYKSSITKINFRSKERGWRTFSMSVKFANGREYCSSVSQDYYLRSFIMDINLRPSCYCCQFKQEHRQSDITLADFWGSESYVPDWNDDTGVSLTLIHTDKGIQLFNSCKEELDIREVQYADAIKCNPSVIKSVKKPPLREAFIKDSKTLRYDKLHRKYCGMNISSRIRRKLAKIVQSISWVK